MNQSVQDVFIIVKQWNVKHVYVQLYSTWTVVWVTAWIQLAALLKINDLSLVRNASKYREWHRFETKKLKQSKKKFILMKMYLSIKTSGNLVVESSLRAACFSWCIIRSPFITSETRTPPKTGPNRLSLFLQ